MTLEVAYESIATEGALPPAYGQLATSGFLLPAYGSEPAEPVEPTAGAVMYLRTAAQKGGDPETLYLRTVEEKENG